MPRLPFDPFTTIFSIGLLYTLMPLAVWTVLRGRHDPRVTGLWCGGAALSGSAYLLFGLRPNVPSLLTYELANLLSYVGYAMRWAAMRRERERAAPLVMLTGVVALVFFAYVAAGQAHEDLRVAYNVIVVALASVLVAWEAWRLAEERDSRSARMVAVTYALLALALVVRLFAQFAGAAPASPGPQLGLDIAFVLITGLLAALWGNVGYLGYAMERLQRSESERSAELAAATARSEQAERQAAELKKLSDERQELLHVISHEVRQPLHNAQAVLQGVEGALRTELAEGEAARGRIERARGVLRQITGSLDNILAASTLLVGQRPTPLRDTDIDMLLQLCLGDLPPDGRSRVQVARVSQVRTAAMDVGLMRLALRNLLNNALAYSLPGSTVMLRVVDSDDPLALVFEVADAGPGIAPELLGKLFERGTRGRPDLPGHGLGLYIVRVAMRLQGGSAVVRSTPEGTTFTLSLPQGVEPA